MSGKIELSVILPTYNESKNIEKLIPRIESLLDAQKIKGEIIVVDDSSPDGTAETAEKMRQTFPNIVVLDNQPKEGIGKALAKGYDLAQGEWLLSMDADGSIQPDEIRLLLNERKNGFDFIIGSKYIQGAVYQKDSFGNQFKSKVSELGNRYIGLVSGVSVRDFSLNFRLLKKEVWKAIHPQDRENFFLVEMLVQAHRKRFKIKEIPTSFLPRGHGQSKTRVWKQSAKFFLKATRFLFS